MKDTQTIESIMSEFAQRTGLSDLSRPKRRYLWTDAFAVCNFLELYRQTKDEHYKEMALLLVDAVHSVLGRYHHEDERKGYISGLKNAQEHPTIAGLRIGKAVKERAPDELYDERAEWDREGQYFHYLTKWMFALSQVARVSRNAKYIRWAVELAKTAHRAFTYKTVDGTMRMYWKMSTDLSRPLVASMGQHDALDAYITYLHLSKTASEFKERVELSQEIQEASAMMSLIPLQTQDSLGLGGLLSDACKTVQLIILYGLPLEELLISLLDAAEKGIKLFSRSENLLYPAEYRLAFRELGLSIGLHGLEMVRDLVDENAELFKRKEAINGALLRLSKYIPLAGVIEKFWIEPLHQKSPTWREHQDINSVMLATSLAPEGFLRC